jgi:hypothetical protein
MKSTIKIAQVAFGFEEMDAAGLCTEADGTITGLTGNTYITVVPIPLGPVGTAGSLAFQVAAVRSNLAEIAGGNKSETLTRQLSLSANAVMLSLKSNGHSVEDQANALAEGNLVLAKKIILSTGYKLRKDRSGSLRTFEVVATGPNWVHYHTNKTKKGTEGQLWRYALLRPKIRRLLPVL